jgi:predicted NUDIX family NTP pyrophosphohydrolase
MDMVHVEVYPHEAEMYALSMKVSCWHLDWQVSSAAQIFHSLSQIFSTVEHLTLEHGVHSRSSEEHSEVDRTEWRKLLRSFNNVKTLRIDDGLVEELSRCLRLDDGEHPLELLPELQELRYTGSGNTGDAFTPFIDARQNAGRAVTLVRP